MKKLFLLLISITIIDLYLQAQTPITLTQSNFAKLSTYNVNDGSSIPTITFGGADLTFDYGTMNFPALSPIIYNTASDVFFTPYCDAYFAGNHTVSGLMYNVNYYYTTNSSMYGENAIHIPAQGYSETSVTGGASDSIIFPEQKMILPVAREIVKFPCTVGYTNTSVSRRPVDFQISVAAYGLNHTPAQNVFTTTRRDTITGYGKMRVYTPAGPSKYYSVLIL